MERARHRGRIGTGEWVKGRASASRAGIRERRAKRLLLVWDVQEYWNYMRWRAPIRFESYNIRNGWNSGLESDLSGMSQSNLDLVVFQETKLMGGVYTCGSAGYSFVATDTPIRHRGGVAVFYQTSLWYAVEAIHQFVPNIVGFHLATG